jgi:hypothetical protein
MIYVNTSPLQSFMSKTISYILIVNSINESDLSMYGLGKIYTYKYEKSWYIDQDHNTYTNGTLTKEHNPKSKRR